jgi:hypothetical protein
MSDINKDLTLAFAKFIRENLTKMLGDKYLCRELAFKLKRSIEFSDEELYDIFIVNYKKE